MSIVTIPQVLEVALASILPSIDTVYPNIEYTPVEDRPYQRVDVLFAKPSNSYISQNYVQKGYMQVTLFYPLMTGPLDARARAHEIREKFKSGSIFSGVLITETPEIGASSNQEDRFVIPVFVRFSQYIKE